MTSRAPNPKDYIGFGDIQGCKSHKFLRYPAVGLRILGRPLKWNPSSGVSRPIVCGAPYSGVLHIRFPILGGMGSFWILGFGVPSRPNPSSGALKSTLPGPREGLSILNADLVAVDVTKPYELIGFGVLGVTKPYEFI